MATVWVATWEARKRSRIKRVRTSSEVRRWAVAIGGITVAAFAVSAWLSGGFGRMDALAGLVVSLVYTVCIGTLVSAVCARTWPWAEGRGAVVVWTVRIGSVLAAVALGTLIGLVVLWNLELVRGRSFWRTYLFNLQFAAFISFSFGLAVMIYEYWRVRYERSELERERALKLATEARLASLESRIHPHFLFNTLNSISSLIHSDPMAADAQLQRLCALLRFSLDSSETRLVSLGQEMKIVRDYLDIEKTRFGDRLRFSFDVPDSVLGCSVPPLAVQTLVENAVKHVVAPSRTGGAITVGAAVAGGVLTVSVSDSGPGVGAGSIVPGHGLDNLRSRLEVLFADRGRLAFDSSTVRLEVPA
jgi:signal transduction histidine kinase